MRAVTMSGSPSASWRLIVFCGLLGHRVERVREKDPGRTLVWLRCSRCREQLASLGN